MCIRDRYGIPLYNSVKVELKENEIVSLIPQTKAKLSTDGLVWELDNETLELGVREGARNLTFKKEISIEIHKGSILLFIDSRFPKSVKLF